MFTLFDFYELACNVFCYNTDFHIHTGVKNTREKCPHIIGHSNTSYRSAKSQRLDHAARRVVVVSRHYSQFRSFLAAWLHCSKVNRFPFFFYMWNGLIAVRRLVSIVEIVSVLHRIVPSLPFRLCTLVSHSRPTVSFSRKSCNVISVSVVFSRLHASPAAVAVALSAQTSWRSSGLCPCGAAHLCWHVDSTCVCSHFRVSFLSSGPRRRPLSRRPAGCRCVGRINFGKVPVIEIFLAARTRCTGARSANPFLTQYRVCSC